MAGVLQDPEFRRQMILEKYRNHSKNMQSLLNSLFLANVGAIAAIIAFLGSSSQSGTYATNLGQVSHWFLAGVALFVASTILLAVAGFLSFIDQRRSLTAMASGKREVLDAAMTGLSRLVLTLLCLAVLAFLAGALGSALAVLRLFWLHS